MFLKNYNSIVLIILIAINLALSAATKCGDFYCKGEAECQLNQQQNKLECTCEEGFTAHITGNVYNCYPSTPILYDGVKCLEVGEKCGPERTCNHNLVCEKTNPIIEKNCAASENECLERCCYANELCVEGKCIISSPVLETECPESLICLDKCCAANEICAQNGTCVIRKPEIEQCPESQKCRDKCCNANQECQNDSRCIAKEDALNECPDNQICFGNCCAENEVCGENHGCVPRDLLNADCPQSRKCLHQCCALTQICSRDFKCEDESAATSTPSASFPVMAEECALNRQCSNKCCQEDEKCSQFNECIPINVIECIETEICGDKCCPINETCNEQYECVSFIENCPEKQQCSDKCCEAQEVCNELDECVARVVKKELLHFDILSATESTFDATVHLTGLKHQELPITSCGEDNIVCQNKCCNRTQACSPTGECVDNNNQTNLKVIDCTGNENCAEAESATGAKTSLAYTIIGLGCLVMVLSFGLFKVYAFKHSNGIFY